MRRGGQRAVHGLLLCAIGLLLNVLVGLQGWVLLAELPASPWLLALGLGLAGVGLAVSLIGVLPLGLAGVDYGAWLVYRCGGSRPAATEAPRKVPSRSGDQQRAPSW